VQLRKHFYQATRFVTGLLVVMFAMTGAAKLADQIVSWLAFAVWQPFTIADALLFWGIPHRTLRTVSDSAGSRTPSCRGLAFRHIFCSPAPAFSCLRGSIARSAASRANPLTHLLRAGLMRSTGLPVPREHLKSRANSQDGNDKGRPNANRISDFRAL
jgi:hypothetical protein